MPAQTEDAFTQDVIAGALSAASQEMFVAMAQAAMSSVIYEVLDFGVAITDGEGNLASAGAGIPGFVSMLAPAVRAVLNSPELAPLQAGDVFISNDPYNGGVSHANDVVLCQPVFVDQNIVAWTASKGHLVDIGGMVPGSMSPSATEIFQEGLLLPTIRLFDGGKPIGSVFSIIRANSRLPEQALGDLWAGLAALRLGEKRVIELCEKYGTRAYIAAVRRYMDYGEAMALSGLKALPHGEFHGHDRLDDGRMINATIHISDREMVIDLRDNPDQEKGPINGTREATEISAQAVFKAITLPEPWANAGCFRPLRLLTRPGSIFHALRPAAVGLYYENKIRCTDLLCKTLAPHMPDVVPAGHFSSICSTVIRALDHDGAEHTLVEPEVGGWGAGLGWDGDNAQFSYSHGDTFNCPVEVNERRNAIHVECYALNPEPTGAGEFRGGKGVDLRYRIVGERGWVTAGYTRHKSPPWGLLGGESGTGNRLEILRATGEREPYGEVTNLELVRGDVVRILTGNGGGLGEPSSRQLTRIHEDLRNGYITSDEARAYGVRADDAELDTHIA
ncbi:MAG: hydantoinase B/oxoprolinase family protein [Gammaproteobacteria bacterium]|nr:hydantoinase B/oxoprolinase family protein [Gammaproteobacteria bacterium]